MKNLILGLALIALVFSPSVGLETSLFVSGSLFIASLILPQMSGVALMAIPIQDAQNIYTKSLLAVYTEEVYVTKWLTSFFKPQFTMTKEVSIEVQRGSEKIAVDVHRFTDGNRNTFDKVTEKIFVPPYFYEYLTLNEHRLYEMAINGIASGNYLFLKQMTADQARQMVKMRDKIERAIELMCAQIFDNGVIQLDAATDIDFKRKAGSIVAYNAANAFNIDTVDPRVVLSNGCQWIRENGKYQAATFNVILGETAMQALINNALIKGSSDLKDFKLGDIHAPEQMPLGATSHGVLSCGSYNVYLWTYPGMYENQSGTMVNFINDKKAIILPTTAEFDLAFGAVPQLITKNGTIPQTAEYLIQEIMDEDKGQHKVSIKAAPLPVPTKIDLIYTIQVIA